MDAADVARDSAARAPAQNLDETERLAVFLRDGGALPPGFRSPPSRCSSRRASDSSVESLAPPQSPKRCPPSRKRPKDEQLEGSRPKRRSARNLSKTLDEEGSRIVVEETDNEGTVMDQPAAAASCGLAPSASSAPAPAQLDKIASLPPRGFAAPAPAPASFQGLPPLPSNLRPPHGLAPQAAAHAATPHPQALTADPRPCDSNPARNLGVATDYGFEDAEDYSKEVTDMILESCRAAEVKFVSASVLSLERCPLPQFFFFLSSLLFPTLKTSLADSHACIVDPELCKAAAEATEVAAAGQAKEAAAVAAKAKAANEVAAAKAKQAAATVKAKEAAAAATKAKQAAPAAKPAAKEAHMSSPPASYTAALKLRHVSIKKLCVEHLCMLKRSADELEKLLGMPESTIFLTELVLNTITSAAHRLAESHRELCAVKYRLEPLLEHLASATPGIVPIISATTAAPAIDPTAARHAAKS